MLKKTLIAIALLAIAVPALADFQWHEFVNKEEWPEPILVKMHIPRFAWLELPEFILLEKIHNDHPEPSWWQGKGTMTVWCNFVADLSLRMVPTTDPPIGDMSCKLDNMPPGEAYRVGPTGNAGHKVDVKAKIENVDPASVAKSHLEPCTEQVVAEIYVTVTVVEQW